MTDASAVPNAVELEAFLEAELREDVTGVEVLADGLNLIIGVSTTSDDPGYVLRRPNKLRDAAYMNDIRAEYGVLSRLRETAVPVPEAVLFCEDDSILGEPWYLMTSLEGDVVPLGSELPERFREETSRRCVAEGLVDALAAIHSVDADQFADVCEHVSPQARVDRTVDRLEAVTEVTGRELATLRRVGDWLQENAPSTATTPTTLVHGDFRPGNALFAGRRTPEITGVLDWETASLGDPLFDLGYLLLRWRDDGDAVPSLEDLERRYPEAEALERLRDVDERGLAPFTSKPGSPSRRELVARYEDSTGIAFENERFYTAFAAFSLAAVWEDLHRSALEAEGESDYEPHVDYMAQVAALVIDGDREL